MGGYSVDHPKQQNMCEHRQKFSALRADMVCIFLMREVIVEGGTWGVQPIGGGGGENAKNLVDGGGGKGVFPGGG